MPFFTQHAERRVRQRKISLDDVDAALTHPLVSYSGCNDTGPIQVYRGESVTVVVGSDDRIVTVYRCTKAEPVPVLNAADHRAV